MTSCENAWHIYYDIIGSFNIKYLHEMFFTICLVKEFFVVVVLGL